MTVKREKRIRSIGELVIALRASNCRVACGDTPVSPNALRMDAAELIRELNAGRLWAVTYHKVGDDEREEQRSR